MDTNTKEITRSMNAAPSTSGIGAARMLSWPVSVIPTDRVVAPHSHRLVFASQYRFGTAPVVATSAAYMAKPATSRHPREHLC